MLVTSALRIAHVGNIANNAYSNAKFQRRLGISADSYNYPFEFIFGHPEWEDAEFDARLSLFQPPDWRAVPLTNGYVRPPWAKYLSGRRHPYSYTTHAEASSRSGCSSGRSLKYCQVMAAQYSIKARAVGTTGESSLSPGPPQHESGPCLR